MRSQILKFDASEADGLCRAGEDLGEGWAAHAQRETEKWRDHRLYRSGRH